ncbi:MAG: alpha/beta fold hydrolase [candidate division Zixibacteria bacterium]|nr:alpha/beta fold hydrolase [candidate division Zixibacteria bacterium]
MSFRIITMCLALIAFSFTFASAQYPEQISDILEDVDPWVTTDTARIMEFIDSTNQAALDMLQSSRHWQEVEKDLSFLLGIDLITSPQIDNTGRIYFMMRLTGEQSALFYVDEPMGWPIQITPNNWPNEGTIISGYDVHPSGDYIIVKTNKYGDEMHDLHYFDRFGKFRPLLVSRDRRYTGVILDRENPDQFFLYLMQGPNIHFARYTISNEQLDTVYYEEGSVYPLDYQDDKLMFVRYKSFSEVQLAMVDLKTDEVTELSDWTQFYGATFVENNQVLALTSAKSKQDEFMKFCLMDLDKPKKWKVVYDPKMAADGFHYNPANGVVIATLNKDGYSMLKGFELYGNDFSVPEVPIGVIYEITNPALTGNANNQYVFSFSSPKTPPTVFTFKLGEDKIQKVGEVSTFGFDFSDIDVRVIRYESEDGTMVPSLIYKRKDIEKDGTNPAIISYHGGPPMQSRPWFQRNIAFALSRGFVVMFPNVRGSSGYGPAWEEADNREGRFEALQDAEGAIDYLIDEGYSNPDKIAIWGGSYGGYTVNWLATHASDKIACVVSQIAISDFKHMFEYTGVQSFIKGYELEYGKSGSDLLEQLSPINYADDVDVPILFKTGFNDPRVPPSDSRRFAFVLKKLGKDVWLYEEVESGHGGSSKEQVIFDLTSSYVFTLMHVSD